MYHTQGTGQASKTEKEQTVGWKEKVHQVLSKCYGPKISQKGSKAEKKEQYWGTTCIRKNKRFWPRIH